MKLNLEIRYRAGFEVGNICSNLEIDLLLENNLFENWPLNFSQRCFHMQICFRLQISWLLIIFELGNIFLNWKHILWTWKDLWKCTQDYFKTQLPQFQPFSRTFPYPRNVSNFKLGFPTSSMLRVKCKLSSFKLTLVRTVVKVKWRSVWVLSE